LHSDPLTTTTDRTAAVDVATNRTNRTGGGRFFSRGQLGDMMSYTDVMDFHLGLFTLDLDSWLSRFVADGVAFHALAWTSVDG
jgi:hypothetical protein